MLRPIDQSIVRAALHAAFCIASTAVASIASAQITDPRITTATESRVATLDEQLINQLRATTPEQQAYVRLVIQHVEQGKLDQRLIIAIQRYAHRKNPSYPFPYFERATRFEAGKRGIELPPVQLLIGSASTYLPTDATR